MTIELLYLLLPAIAWATLLFKANYPHIKWGCLFGMHEYYYVYERHGMYFNTKTDNIVGTKRKVYMCSCEKEKITENKDWIN